MLRAAFDDHDKRAATGMPRVSVTGLILNGG
jgi:hypothetical protein